MGIQTSDKPLLERVKESEQDKFMQASVAKAQDAQHIKREDSRALLGNWEQWRELGEQIRQRALKYLPDYLEQFSDNVEKNGGDVFFAATEKDAVDYIEKIVKETGAKRIVKSKSMVTTEIDLDKRLLAMNKGLQLMETDLAEFILQEDDWDEPTHIVFPTLHKNRDQVREIFMKLGYEGDNDPMHLARFARKFLREYFLQADLGITGCNFAVADNGMINLVTNEGNADLTMAIPKTQIVVMGMERIVPTMNDAEILDNMLCRSAVGQKLTSYVTFEKGQVAGETDGPEHFHVVIVDNNRSRALGSEFQSILQCIRCGACMNVCPVYRHIGGHGYGSIYPGPLGAVLSPILGGYQAFQELPYASSLCGACTEVCPVKIPLHKLLIEHRRIITDQRHMQHGLNNLMMEAIGIGTGFPWLFRTAVRFGHLGLKPLASKGEVHAENFIKPEGSVKGGPGLVGGWADVRDLPLPPKNKDSFRQWFAKHKANQPQPGDQKANQ
ncbi:MAG: LutB/LldF family L-lactate oxidation iron-sulfur protein [Lactobacillus sp.]|jgi:L-lactate dehydrogenase complex protein LldF|nr:LutB/LldF family L-lactate oxidation iron-sulfur protein [Lactobacillus sp.]